MLLFPDPRGEGRGAVAWAGHGVGIACAAGARACDMSTAGELGRIRQLLVALAWRDVRVRYKQSLLGLAWAVALPLSMMLLFTFVFTKAIDAMPLLGIRAPYPLYAFVGLAPWTFFANSLNGCVNSLVANRNLVTKIYFPREVFPLSAVAAALVDFVVALGVLVALIAYFHLRGDFAFAASAALAVIPALIVIQIALTVGLGLILAMANLFYRDVRFVTSVLVQLWMFVSAVVVPIPRDGSLSARIIALNPLVPLIEGYRAALLEGTVPPLSGLLYSAGVAGAMLAGGWLWFRRASFRFAECI
jgi:ABC-type polysaccharide/polyol phosphate export permease